MSAVAAASFAAVRAPAANSQRKNFAGARVSAAPVKAGRRAASTVTMAA